MGCFGHSGKSAVEQADEQTGEDLNRGRGEEGTKVERRDFCRHGIRPAGDAGATQQVNDVPDAMEAENAVDLRGNNHGDAASDTALDAARDGEGLQGQLRTMCLVDLDASNLNRNDCDGNDLFLCLDRLVALLRKDVAEPTDTGDDGEDNAKNTDAVVGDQRSTGEDKTHG